MAKEGYREGAEVSAEAEAAALAEYSRLLLRLRALILLPAGLFALISGTLAGGAHALGYLPLWTFEDGSQLIGGPTLAVVLVLGAAPFLAVGYGLYRYGRERTREAWAARCLERYGLDRGSALGLSRMLS